MYEKREKSDGQATPLNASVLKRRTRLRTYVFNTYARERDDTALYL